MFIYKTAKFSPVWTTILKIHPNFVHQSLMFMFFTKICKFWPFAPKQNHCHGNAPSYCQLRIISNDVLYNYTKSEKVSLGYWEPLWHNVPLPLA